ncbi:hypothetical protein GD1_153 [Paraglaciecola Antarctic GD virus 1]|nr:hypothetical protein GD1_153 [Paraglaciecola Antarctic GD virus 1]
MEWLYWRIECIQWRFSNHLATVAATQISSGLWEPVSGDKHLIQKTNTDLQIFIGVEAHYCQMWKPLNYEAFNFFGKRLVHNAAKRLCARVDIDKAEKARIEEQLIGL